MQKFFYFILIILLSSCSDQIIKPNTSNQITYLALGDSYTIGEGVRETQRYPVLLVDSLKKVGIDIAAPRIIATTGWTTDELQAGIRNQNLGDTTFDLVSLLIGVNNQYRGRSIEQYKVEFTELLLQSIAFAKNNKDKVFVISIPDYGVTPFAANNNPSQISAAIDVFNAANKAIADSLGVTYFDITPISRLAENDPSLLAPDQLHPSGKMYKMWVDLMFEEVKNLMNP